MPQVNACLAGYSLYQLRHRAPYECSKAGMTFLIFFYSCAVKVFECCLRFTEQAYQYMSAQYFDMVVMVEEIYTQPSAYGAKKLANQVVTEESWEEEKTGSNVSHNKSKCTENRELLESDAGV